ncbi:MAG: TIM barrel protein [Symploca sp. SIO2E9]|nr:TIM barrel protein [Symploca sp. SIO2E9]
MNLKPWFLKFSTLALTIIVSLTIFSLPAGAYEERDLQQLLETGECTGCDLSGAFLLGEDLSQADLSNANLSQANLYNADLRQATLSNANLDEANLEGAELNNANLSNAEVENGALNNAILVGANLSGADFSKADMPGANLENATLAGNKLCDAILFEATMPDRTTYDEEFTNLSDYDVDLNCNAGDGEDVLSPVSCTVANNPISFDSDVRLGITPTGWSNSDDLTIDLNPPISYQQILSEIAVSGFYGTQNAPKFPKKGKGLEEELQRRGLTISEPWVGTYFTLGYEGQQESERIFQEQLDFMKDFDSKIIVVAELGGAVHQQPIDPIKNEPEFNETQKEALFTGLKTLADMAEAKTYTLVYHPHVGTGVATIAQVEELMKATAKSPLGLLLDTGHLYYATYGHDSTLTQQEIQGKIEALTNTYKDRIKHVHLKNIRHNKLVESRCIGKGDDCKVQSFLNSIRAGVFTVPGDDDGAIDFNPILEKLAGASYEGWLVVEAEQDPNTTIEEYQKTPLDYALMAREYLCEQTGL